MNRWTLALSYALFIATIIILADIGLLKKQLGWLHSIPFGDKVGHITLYGMLSALFINAFKFRVIHLWRTKCYLGALIIAIVAVTEECTQILFSSRNFDGYDLTANLIGVLLSSVIMYRFSKTTKAQVAQ
ncbi:VanZ family protein [Alteromonas sp. KUL49]|uniref:VanZ family protein n=1 Tax=Alteromonas sp. KUL49 TaxID=2480798 RepID=UPI00102EF136|nr:VanZ family protein [Alteromonas sp. KUL49]TAP41360.1 trypsin [Alteromonas sp. KUL49]GEA10431.1 hypothetical protein KUL49_08060 [Alteromonas sp. KUL49]